MRDGVNEVGGWSEEGSERGSEEVRDGVSE